MNCIMCNKEADFSIDFGFTKKYYCKICYPQRYGLKHFQYEPDLDMFTCENCRVTGNLSESLSHLRINKSLVKKGMGTCESIKTKSRVVNND